MPMDQPDIGAVIERTPGILRDSGTGSDWEKSGRSPQKTKKKYKTKHNEEIYLESVSAHMLGKKKPKFPSPSSDTTRSERNEPSSTSSSYMKIKTTTEFVRYVFSSSVVEM